MNTIRSCITSAIDDQNTVFVFPSDIAASAWADEMLFSHTAKAVSLERFIAWDTFKERSIKAHVAGKKSTSTVLRKLFAESVIADNSKHPFFTSLIPQSFATEANHFASWLSNLLPSLSGWKTVFEQQKGSADAEDTDLLQLHTLYEHFLQENALFEPAWEKPPLEETGFSYIIFYPELIEDFQEYAALLQQSPNITLVTLHSENDAAENKNKLNEFSTTRAELKTLAVRILELIEQGVSYNDIAVSVPNLNDLESYILREFALHSIPVQYRAGKMLGVSSAGRFFPLVQSCAQENFSFATMKALLLDDQLPWKEKELNENLILFGQKNCCVCSYQDNNTLHDVWESAFCMNGHEEQLHLYYQNLKKTIIALTRSASFAEIREQYFTFKSRFFDESAFSVSADAVMSRCITELVLLIQMEQQFPAIRAAHPFAFFVSHLNGKNYLPQGTNGGVMIFPYRVAAATPFAHHFVINASQNNVTVLYRSLPFLSPAKRQTLGLEEYDASAAFLTLYQSEETTTVFSSSIKTFSDYTTPHGFFLGHIEKTSPVSDLYDAEKTWWLTQQSTVSSASTPTNSSASAFLPTLHGIQADGFINWYAGKQNAPQASDQSHLWPLLDAKLREKAYGIKKYDFTTSSAPSVLYPDLPRVSASSLREFFECPSAWLFNHVFDIEEVNLDASIMDDTGLGILYHKILQTLMLRIKQNNPILSTARLPEYNSLISDITAECTASFKAFKGPLAAPLLEAQTKNITRQVQLFFERFLQFFDSYAVISAEEENTLVYDTFVLTGKIDCILSVPEADSAVIIDYKLNGLPSRPLCYVDADNKLENFQIPVYIKLYENTPPAQKGDVSTAVFLSIRKEGSEGKCLVLGKMRNPKATKMFTAKKENLDDELSATDSATEFFAHALSAMNFTLKDPIPYETCSTCDYRTICRTTYTVSGEKECHIAK